MAPVLHIGGVTVRSYFLCAALAALLAMGISLLRLKKYTSGKWLLILPITGIVCALVGARALNVFLNPTAYRNFSPFTLSYEKLSLMGGLVLAIVPMGVLCRVKKLPFWAIGDDLVLPAGLCIMILKVGCFLNGCCYGKKTDCLFGMHFPTADAAQSFLGSIGMGPKTLSAVHPAQLYEIFGALCALLLAYFLGKALHLQPGGRFGIFSAGFSLARLIILPLRTLPYPARILHRDYPLFYLLLIITGIGIFLFRGRPRFCAACKTQKKSCADVAYQEKGG